MKAFKGAKLSLFCITLLQLSEVRGVEDYYVAKAFNDNEFDMFRWEEKLDRHCGRFGYTYDMEFSSRPIFCPEGEFCPSYVAISSTVKNVTILCSGTLIYPNKVLSTRSCLRKLSGLELSAGLLHTTEEGKGTPTVRGRYTCLSHKPGDEHDYGVVELERPFKLTDKVQPACLPKHPIGFNEKTFAVGITGNPPRSLEAWWYMHRCPVEVGARNGSLLQCFLPVRRGTICEGSYGGPLLAIRDPGYGRQYVVGLTHHAVTPCDADSSHPTYFLDTYQIKAGIIALVQRCSMLK